MTAVNDIFRTGPAFVGYITAGDGGIDYTVETAAALAEGGVDILELGIPFSDPVADGPVIRKAMSRALNLNITVNGIFRACEKIKKLTGMPVYLFSYYNPVLCGGDSFYTQAAATLADGILIVDLPPEEAASHIKNCSGAKLDTIFIVSPSTPDARVKKICAMSRPFVYYACRKGTTGVRDSLPEGFDSDISRISSLSPVPVVAGFGISSRKAAGRVIAKAGGFVTGSFFVEMMGRCCPPEEISKAAKNIDPRRK